MLIQLIGLIVLYLNVFFYHLKVQDYAINLHYRKNIHEDSCIKRSNIKSNIHGDNCIRRNNIKLGDFVPK